MADKGTPEGYAVVRGERRERAANLRARHMRDYHASLREEPTKPTSEDLMREAIKDFLDMYNGSMTEMQLHVFVRDRFGYSPNDVDKLYP